MKTLLLYVFACIAIFSMASALISNSKPAVVAEISAAQIATATELCAPNGGLQWVRRTATCASRGCTWRYWTQATCVNGATFTKEAA